MKIRLDGKDNIFDLGYADLKGNDKATGKLSEEEKLEMMERINKQVTHDWYNKPVVRIQRTQESDYSVSSENMTKARPTKYIRRFKKPDGSWGYVYKDSGQKKIKDPIKKTENKNKEQVYNEAIFNIVNKNKEKIEKLINDHVDKVNNYQTDNIPWKENNKQMARELINSVKNMSPYSKEYQATTTSKDTLRFDPKTLSFSGFGHFSSELLPIEIKNKFEEIKKEAKEMSYEHEYYHNEQNVKKDSKEYKERKKILDSYENIDFDKDLKGKKVVGYRYGEAPSSGYSWNYADDKPEPGVSMAKIGNLNENNLMATRSLREQGVKKYYYEGVISGKGGDGEITLINVKPIDQNLFLKRSKEKDHIDITNKIAADEANTSIILKRRGFNLPQTEQQLIDKAINQINKQKDKKPMKKAMIKLFDNLYIDMEKARQHKYYKRVPKKSGKGFDYFYTKDEYDKAKKQEKPKEEKKGGLLNGIMSFFGLKDLSSAEKKVDETYNANKDKLQGIDKPTFSSYLNEYLLNKSKWDQKLSGEKKEKPTYTKDKKTGEVKKKDKTSVMSSKGGFKLSIMKKVAGVVGQQTDIDVGDKIPSRTDKARYERIKENFSKMEDSPDKKGLQKWLEDFEGMAEAGRGGSKEAMELLLKIENQQKDNFGTMPESEGKGGEDKKGIVSSRDKYDISKLKKIGSGSDRNVYDLEDGNVLKVAKNGRGLVQNETELKINESFVAKVKEHGRDYVIMEKLSQPEDNKKIDDVVMFFRGTNDSATDRNSALIEAEEKFGLKGLSKYNGDDIVFGDLMNQDNWGLKNNKLKLVDGAILDRNSLKENKNKDEEFNQISQESSGDKKGIMSESGGKDIKDYIKKESDRKEFEENVKFFESVLEEALKDQVKDGDYKNVDEARKELVKDNGQLKDSLRLEVENKLREKTGGKGIDPEIILPTIDGMKDKGVLSYLREIKDKNKPLGDLELVYLYRKNSSDKTDVDKSPVMSDKDSGDKTSIMSNKEKFISSLEKNVAKSPYNDLTKIWEGEYKNKNVSKSVTNDAENLWEAIHNGDMETVRKINSKYESENKKFEKKGSQRERFVSVDMSKKRLFDLSLKAIDDYNEIQPDKSAVMSKARQATDLLVQELQKAKKAPIGTISGDYKKVAEGKWERVSDGDKKKGKTEQPEDKKDKKPEEGKDDTSARREKIKNTLKKVTSMLADAFSMRDTVGTGGQTVEQAGEDIKEAGKEQEAKNKKEAEKKNKDQEAKKKTAMEEKSKKKKEKQDSQYSKEKDKSLKRDAKK